MSVLPPFEPATLARLTPSLRAEVSEALLQSKNYANYPHRRYVYKWSHLTPKPSSCIFETWKRVKRNSLATLFFPSLTSSCSVTYRIRGLFFCRRRWLVDGWKRREGYRDIILHIWKAYLATDWHFCPATSPSFLSQCPQSALIIPELYRGPRLKSLILSVEGVRVLGRQRSEIDVEPHPASETSQGNSIK
ncbi:hypothetical protein BJY04DRAFT_200867 [Aspergillus karnatakaensis]|uniref:uncharacterized protein n=1 Tax=Aspergillus karnatakaensis TaxID=1810916 RepID=UPI003CCD5997